jgi:hypothetical protein
MRRQAKPWQSNDRWSAYSHAADRCVCSARRSALTDERLLRAHDAELVSLRIGLDGPGFSAGLPMSARRAPRGKKAVDLLLAVGGAAGQAGLHAVLDEVAIGDWQERPAGRRVLVGPVTIARSRSEGIPRPSAWARNRASLGSSCMPGHARGDATRHRDA